MSNNVWFITGAARGMGVDIAKAALAAGHSVVATARDATKVTEAIGNHENLLALSLDITDETAAINAAEAAVDRFGRIDVLVNNAAIMAFEGGIEDSDAVWDKVWAETLQINVKSPADLFRGAVRHYRQVGGGTIITISSWNAQRGSTNPITIAYAASKAAVMASTKTIARAYAKENILAYIVAPGVVRTRLSENFAATQGGEAAVTASLAMGEWVPPGDIAELVAFLATGRCRHLSGATLDVNGASYVR